MIIGDGSAFRRGHDFAAWLGLVPRQLSTSGRTILGRISKRGNNYLWMLFMQAARVVLLRPANWPNHSFGPWLQAAVKRMHHSVTRGGYGATYGRAAALASGCDAEFS